ncbi:entericidin A/B family lipoprotein [Parvularcula oceani]|nr:entericidin A/B family lipoprotein [Parvularcula oceani]
MKIWIRGFAAALLVVCGLSACETTEGFGEDVEDLGEEIQD